MAKKVLSVLLICFLSVSLCCCAYYESKDATLPIIVADPISASLITVPGNVLLERHSEAATEPSETAPTDHLPEAVPAAPTEQPPIVTDPIQTEPAETIIPETTAPGIRDSAPTVSPTATPETESPKTMHNHSYISETIAPTCTAGGYDLFSCSCGEYYKGNHIDPVGHTWGDWSTTVEATTDREGEQERSCTRCGTVETSTTGKKSIPAGNAIFLDNRLSTFETDGVTCLLSYPSETDFGEFTEQAILLYSAIYAKEETITISFPLDEYSDLEGKELQENMAAVFKKFEETFSEKVLNDYIHLLCFKKSYYSGTITYEPSELYADLEKTATSEYALYSALVQAGVYTGMSELEAVRAINNWICDTVSYDSSYYSPIVVLEVRKTNCSGYAALFHAMCRHIGINCQIASGEVIRKEEVAGHAWNRVKIGGGWYFIDVCWNDTTAEPNSYHLSEELWKDHVLRSCESDVYY